MQLYLTAMLTWMAYSWVIPAMNIWPWNNFHVCTELLWIETADSQLAKKLGLISTFLFCNHQDGFHTWCQGDINKVTGQRDQREISTYKFLLLWEITWRRKNYLKVLFQSLWSRLCTQFPISSCSSSFFLPLWHWNCTKSLKPLGPVQFFLISNEFSKYKIQLCKGSEKNILNLSI